jgi:hypothetical protein
MPPMTLSPLTCDPFPARFQASKTSSVSVWDLATGELVQKIAAVDTIVDIASSRKRNQLRLATLTSKALTLWRWEPR